MICRPENKELFFRVVPISLHDLGTFNDEFTFLSWWKVFTCIEVNDFSKGIGHWNTDGAFFLLVKRWFFLDGIGMGNRTRFSESIPFDDICTRDFLESLSNRHW